MNDVPQYRYDFQAIESRWRNHWREHRTFACANPAGPHVHARPKFYVLDMFPYPSGVGLHVGHPLGYIATDIVARYKRMTGHNVLHPMGFDAFGLPAEQFAVEHGVHPAVTTQKNIDNMKRQLQLLGLSYDWDREISTTDVDYYRWTQWIFLQLFNSYFDPRPRKARPISELIAQLESGELVVGPDGELMPVAASGGMDALSGTPVGGRKWYELSVAEQSQLLGEYRLAYLAEVPVNWCPALGTVLANEEVTSEGRSERGNHPVFKRPLKQWMLRITAYAERLIADLDRVDWPESTKQMQRNWIGRSEGAMVDFALENGEDFITVFTTRPDTLFGATYMVLAPEHPLVTSVLIENDDKLCDECRNENRRMSQDTIVTEEHLAEVRAYIQQAAARSEVDRQADIKTKTGVFTGAYAINPVNQRKIPIWIADYVLMGYGTGAIMAVPAHDERDHAFARTFDLPIVQVLAGPGGAEVDVQAAAYCEDGLNVNSHNEEISIDGLPTPEAKKKITQWLEDEGIGKGQVQYKLRDWLFSRQRYWGEPFPILHGPNGEIVAVEESELPVKLPEMEDFRPDISGESDTSGGGGPHPPLGRAPESWRVVEKDGVRYERELNTMPQWAGSCWYYLRFCDPRNDKAFVDADVERYWMNPSAKSQITNHKSQIAQAPMGVDLYVGGVEHAVLHLLYARFWHKVLFDLGRVSGSEPFGRLFNQGYIQAAAYTDARGMYVPADKIEERDQKFFFEGNEVNREFGKMGKSLKNAISPDDMCREYGADTLRLYEMYMGPLDQSKPWNTRDIIGIHRFLQRIWRNFVDDRTGELRVSDEPADESRSRLMHKTIAAVTVDMERLSFNTAIAELIKWNNELVSLEKLPRDVAETMVKLLAPLAPHLAEELWARLGHMDSVAYQGWPVHEARYLAEDQVELPVQVTGKLRGRITVAADADEAAIVAAAKQDANVAAHLEGRTIRKVIVVKGKMVNIVAG
ncbi:MAG: leucine--tRNA ligase [Phycisphaerales bacterium]